MNRTAADFAEPNWPPLDPWAEANTVCLGEMLGFYSILFLGLRGKARG